MGAPRIVANPFSRSINKTRNYFRNGFGSFPGLNGALDRSQKKKIGRGDWHRLVNVASVGAEDGELI